MSNLPSAGRAACLILPLLLALPVAAQETAPSVPTEAPASPTLSAPEPAAPVLPGTDAAPTLPGATSTGVTPTAPAATAAPGASGTATETAPATTPAVTEADPQIPVEAPTGAPATGGSALPHDLSPWGMFMAADIVVKTVMLLLAAASLATWIILLYKAIEMTGARARLKRSAKMIAASPTLAAAAEQLKGRKDPAAFMALSAHVEYRRSVTALSKAGPDGLKERVSSEIDRTTAQAGRRLMRGTGLLATIGSISPFVGLFGTVWGIMNSFIGISQSQTTNLAIVAPGIAEALLATAIGLVAAIPAVIVYNHFARSITGYRAGLGDLGAAVERLLSRDLDFARHPAPAAQAEAA